jgi:serine protease AprX
MRLRKTLPAAATLVAAIMIVAIAGPAAATDGRGPGATLAPAVSEWLETSPPDARLQVIVAFSDAAGISRLKAMAGSLERLKSVPMALVTLSASQIREVASWGETRSVGANEELELHLDESTQMVKADRVWAGQRLARPYLGTGVGVAVLDTGVDTLHPDLPYGAKVKKSFYIAANPLGSGEPQTFVEGGRQTDTEHGHGTHVSSTIAGTGAASGGRYKGVAPGADLYVFKVGAGASVLVWWAARAFDWVIENGAANNIRVISNSWGGGGGEDYNPDDAINILSKAAYDKGIVTVFSAGNGGGPNTIGRNAVSPYVISVGAVNKDFTKAAFSSTGRPGGDMTRDANGLYRPTVTAPGVDINAAHSSMGAVMAPGLDTENPLYTSASGTSMSAPHISGIVALMMEARPGLSAQNVIDIIEGTAVSMPDYEYWQVGAGFVDSLAAVQAAEKGQIKFPPSTKGKTPAYQLVSGQDWTGTVLPAGYTLFGVSNALAHDTTVEVGSGVDALYAEIEWANQNESVYLFLHDPDGNEVESSAALTDIGSVRFRTVVTTNPDPGTWTIRVVGRVNAVTDYRGFYGLYQETTKTGKGTKTPTLTTTTTPFEGEVLTSADAVHDSQFFTFNVPAGATEVNTRIDWSDSTWDIDLFLFDSNGRQAGSSTSGDRNFEEISVTGSTDPMVASAGLPAGEWTVEVRGWLVVAPEPFTGTFSVTHPAQ